MLSENCAYALLILISSSLAVSDGVETTFSGLKKKKKKPVSHMDCLCSHSNEQFFLFQYFKHLMLLAFCWKKFDT